MISPTGIDLSRFLDVPHEDEETKIEKEEYRDCVNRSLRLFKFSGNHDPEALEQIAKSLKENDHD